MKFQHCFICSLKHCLMLMSVVCLVIKYKYRMSISSRRNCLLWKTEWYKWKVNLCNHLLLRQSSILYLFVCSKGEKLYNFGQAVCYLTKMPIIFVYTHILVYRHARCDYKFLARPLILFILVWIIVSTPNFHWLCI